MKYDYPQLPFPRGTSYMQGVDTPAADSGDGLEGQVYEVYDSTYGPLKLRVVRNKTGSALTLNRQCVGFYKDATDQWYNLGKDAYAVASNGQMAKPVDPAYSSYSCPANDLFYVVEEGIVPIGKTTGTNTAVTAAAKVYADTAGKINGTVSTGHAVGKAVKSAADGATSADVYVFPGFVG